jgi:hypothetical protein
VPIRFLAMLFLTACPYVPDGEIRMQAGTLPVKPGRTISFVLYCDPLFEDWELVAGPGHCGHDWTVQGRPGGSDTFGQITDCGVYTPPVARPSEAPVIGASECAWGDECADACSAQVTLSLDGYSVR